MIAMTQTVRERIAGGLMISCEMSGKKNMRNKVKLIAALVVVILLALMCFGIVKGLIGVLNRSDLDAGEPDPMFAEEAVQVTRPPELYAEEEPREHPTLDDYVPEEETPVDKTAAELIEEAQAQS